MARECHRKKGSFFSWRLLSRKYFLKVDLAEERCAGGACGALGRALHWFQSFLSEPVLSDGPLGWSLRLPWSFPFCWAHRDVVNPPGLRESGICLYFNSVGNSLVLCLLSWSLFSQTLGCLYDLFSSVLYLLEIELWAFSNWDQHPFLSFFICPVNILLLLIIKVNVENLGITEKHTDTQRKQNVPVSTALSDNY